MSWQRYCNGKVVNSNPAKASTGIGKPLASQACRCMPQRFCKYKAPTQTPHRKPFQVEHQLRGCSQKHPSQRSRRAKTGFEHFASVIHEGQWPGSQRVVKKQAVPHRWVSRCGPALPSSSTQSPARSLASPEKNEAIDASGEHSTAARSLVISNGP